LPPREYTENGQLWVRYVSPTPATRVDVINLQNDLDKRLQAKQARETGICPIREELYAQCFDEIIRQITINCAERGFLLVRVRDEIKMTIQAYQTLYESSIAYGMRKALMAEQRKNEMQSNIKHLEDTCDELNHEVDRLHQEIDDIVKRDKEDCQREQKAHEDSVEYLKALNQDYKNELETLLSTP
jgi:dynein light intermediate chain